MKIPMSLLALTFATTAGAAYAHPALSRTFPAFTEAAEFSAFAADRPSLDTIVRNWDQYGFLPPTKPA